MSTTRTKILAETFRFLDDALRAIEKLSKQVDEDLTLQREYQKQTARALLKAGGMFLEINLPSVKNSPEPTNDGNVKIVGMEKLRKNYAVIQDLWETRTALDAMEAKLRTSFAGKEVDVGKASGELAKLKKKVDSGLSEAFAFLRGLAEKNLPSKFAAFNDAVIKIVERTLAYEKASVYTYLYEVEGDPTFSSYIELQSVTDDDGTYFPRLYIVTSFRTGATSDSGMYVSLLTEFAPPSEHLLMKKVSTVKDTLNALSMLLALDNFSSSLGSLPIATLMKQTVTRDLFSYQNFIKSIRTDEEQIVFTLKPEVQDKAEVDKITTRIFQDFRSLVRKTNARLRMATRKADRCYIITFFLVLAEDAPPVLPEDLDFLQDRFRLSDTTMRNVVRTINLGR